MTAHALGLLLFAGCFLWSLHVLAAAAADLFAQARADRRGRSWESSARRSDGIPAAAQDQRERL